MKTEDEKRKKRKEKLVGIIERERGRLHYSIEKFGLEAKRTRILSNELDLLINEYHDLILKSFLEDKYFYRDEYNKAYQKLIELVKVFGEFPTIEGWNKFAKELNFLSATSVKYISGMSWHNLRDKVQSEVRKKY